MKKIILVVIFTLIAIPLALLAVFLAVNWEDEALRPEVKLALNWQPPASSFDDNGFLILRGMDAPKGEDASQAGRKIVESEIERYRLSQKVFSDSSLPEKDGALLSMDLKDVKCDYSKEQNCVQFYLNMDRKKAELVYASHQIFLERFRAIKKSKNYVDVIPPSTNPIFPRYHFLVNASELERLHAISNIADGNLESGLHSFIENAQFSRQLLLHSTTVLSRMIAIAMVQHDMRILSELIVKYPRIAKDSVQLAPILTPISSHEYSMQSAFEGEMNFMLKVLNDTQNGIDQNMNTPVLGDQKKWKILSDVTFKRNASLNLSYDISMARLAVAKADARNLTKSFAEYQKKQKSLLGFGVANFYLKNPIGKVLIAISEPDYLIYIERQHDTDGYIRLVALQTKLIAEHPPLDKINDILKNSDQGLRNPYTEQPMEWNAENRELVFQGRQPSNTLLNKSSVYKVSLASN